MIAAAWWAVVAHATICSERITPTELTLTLGLAADDLSDGRTTGVYDTLSPTLERVPCLTEVADPELLARLMRVVAQVHHRRGEPEAARWWATGSRSSAELPWSYVFPDTHPFRAMVAEARVARPVRLDDAGLRVPVGGGMFVNGRPIQLPEAPAAGPVLVQLFDDHQRLVDGWWQVGAAFPDTVLSTRSRVVPLPLWWKGSGPRSARYRPNNDPAVPIGPTAWSSRR